MSDKKDGIRMETYFETVVEKARESNQPLKHYLKTHYSPRQLKFLLVLGRHEVEEHDLHVPHAYHFHDQAVEEMGHASHSCASAPAPVDSY